MQTINEQRALTERQLLRIERANPDHFRFPRHSGAYERTLPFAENVEKHEFRDAVIGTVVFFGLIGSLIFLPWVMA